MDVVIRLFFDYNLDRRTWNMKDIIDKKRRGLALSKKEMEYAFLGYLEGKIPDYQMSALLMAICIQGMTDEETFLLTDLFLHSGNILDFSEIPGIKVDKHSTGGVGDKTTLLLVPIVASLGIPVIKMSGRGLGYTGGTIDKLESIPGFRTDLSEEEIMKQVQEIGAVMVGQTKELCPLDKKIYALRDVSGTTDSIPLIASSIMSKKIAGGADKILIDIKVGSGAFMKTEEDALRLSDLMIKIGNYYGKETRTIISNMDVPLGYAVGNSLEVKEALAILKGEEEGPLKELVIDLACEMVSMGKNISKEKAKTLVIDSLDSLKAYQKFLEIITYQGGNISALSISSNVESVYAVRSGVIESIDALEVAKLACTLGAGRLTKEDTIDSSVGVLLKVGIGDVVSCHDELAVLYKKEGDYKIYDSSHIFKIS